jgi:hypothetical protein
MATIGSLTVLSVLDYVLDHYVRGPMLAQNEQDKPLLAFLNSGAKEFPSGKQYISEPVKGTFMSDTSGFFAGYSNDDALVFTQRALGVRAQFQWYEQHAGLVLTHTELKKEGITVVDGESKTSNHGDVKDILTGILEDALEDFGLSWARAKNNMAWRDGSQDAKQTPGILALLLDDPTTGTVGGLAQATYSWWRSRVSLALAPSGENQTMSKFFRTEGTQLRRYGGKPSKALCGQQFWDAMAVEVEKKGIYTQSGFSGKETDISITGIRLPGIGTLQYDPTLDDLGLGKRCYVLDSQHLKWRPMTGEKNHQFSPARPYQYLVMLKSMTDTSGLTVNQLNGMGVYGIA